MTTIEIEDLGAGIVQAVRHCGAGRLDCADVDDIAQEILFKTQARRGKIRNLPAYIRRAAHNSVINLLTKRAGRKTDQIEDDPEAHSIEGEAPAADSVLSLLENRYPEKYEFIRKSVKIIDRLYRVSLTRDNPNVSMLLCLDRAVNVLSEAKHEIDNMMFRTGPDNFGVYKFRRQWGIKISRWLQDEIDLLWSGRESVKGLPLMFRLPDFVIDALPKLRADPIMLLLRVLYKIFKIGSGKYGARAMIRKIILELKLREAGGVCDIFKSISEKTNFETLRKKIYKKTLDPFYDKLAVFICEASRS